VRLWCGGIAAYIAASEDELRRENQRYADAGYCDGFE